MIFKYNNTEFGPYSGESKIFYALQITNKAKYSKRITALSADLQLSKTLQEVFSTPYNVSSEIYIWSFQYKLLNNILFKNTKLFKLGLIDSEKCSVCTIYKEDLCHLFYDNTHVRALWKRFCNWWSNHLSENLSLSLKDIVVGILIRKDILNYLIILGKLCVWDCRRKNRSQSSSFWKPRRNYHVPSAIEKEGTAGIIKAFSRRDLHLKWRLLDKATTHGFVRRLSFEDLSLHRGSVFSSWK